MKTLTELMELADAYAEAVAQRTLVRRANTHADLKASLAEVFAENERLAGERDAAIAERDALKADAERLDWFETQGISYGFEGVLEGNRWGICGPFTTLRIAIDAAMKGTS
jgi:hypothetical protein